MPWRHDDLLMYKNIFPRWKMELFPRLKYFRDWNFCSCSALMIVHNDYAWDPLWSLDHWIILFNIIIFSTFSIGTGHYCTHKINSKFLEISRSFVFRVRGSRSHSVRIPVCTVQGPIKGRGHAQIFDGSFNKFTNNHCLSYKGFGSWFGSFKTFTFSARSALFN